MEIDRENVPSTTAQDAVLVISTISGSTMITQGVLSDMKDRLLVDVLVKTVLIVNESQRRLLVISTIWDKNAPIKINARFRILGIQQGNAL